MSDVGSGGSRDLQALVGPFYISSPSSKDPDMDLGLRDIRPGTEVGPALLDDWQEPSPALCSKAFLLLS
jgi:hypothetical protein